MNSINSVSNYRAGSSKPSTPQKAGSNTVANNAETIDQSNDAGTLNKYWGRPNSIQKTGSGSNATSFQISEGKLDVQATRFIEKWDANQDGVLDIKEFKQSDGLTGGVKTKIGSAELAQALWASISGSDGTLSAAEYARALVGMDENLDGTITQAESDKIKTKWAKDSLADPGKANVRIYNDLVALGTDVGLDSVFALGYEEKYAKWLEAEILDSSEEDSEMDTASLVANANDLSDISGLLSDLGIEMPKTTTSKTSTPAKTSTSNIDPTTLALLKSLGIDTSTLPTGASSTKTTSSTAGSDANYGFSDAVLATLHPPKNVVDGLPIA